MQSGKLFSHGLTRMGSDDARYQLIAGATYLRLRLRLHRHKSLSRSDKWRVTREKNALRQKLA